MREVDIEQSSRTKTDANPESWVDEHGSAMFRYAILRLPDRAVAEDLVQEAFVAAITNIASFKERSSLRTWLIGILRNKISDYFRQQLRRNTETLTNEYAQAALTPKSLWTEDPAKIIEQREFWELYHDCVVKLPPLLSDAYSLRELRELSTEQICDLLGITSKNLSLRVHRARVELRACLERKWSNKT